MGLSTGEEQKSGGWMQQPKRLAAQPSGTATKPSRPAASITPMPSGRGAPSIQAIAELRSAAAVSLRGCGGSDAFPPAASRHRGKRRRLPEHHQAGITHRCKHHRPKPWRAAQFSPGG